MKTKPEKHDPYDGMTREEYLDDLAENMGADSGAVHALADVLGEDEDFDGLVTSLEDFLNYL